MLSASTSELIFNNEFNNTPFELYLLKYEISNVDVTVLGYTDLRNFNKVDLPQPGGPIINTAFLASKTGESRYPKYWKKASICSSSKIEDKNVRHASSLI